MKLLCVDDEPVALTSVRRVLKRRGYRNVEICDNGREAVERIKRQNFDLVLLDIIMPDLKGLEVLATVKPHCPLTEFIVVTAVEDVSTAVKALRLGAYDYLVKPIDPNRLVLSMERALERKGLRAGLTGSWLTGGVPEIPDAFSHIVTRSSRMGEIIAYVEIMSRSGKPILITCASGTGKELMALGIHHAGPGRDAPFVAVNVTSVPEALFESQFFGHAKGAFTGATGAHAGYFEQADGGTLYLDEIGELPLDGQVKLLRALEDSHITRIGEGRPRAIDVRIVSSTNIDLNRACRENRFRTDLFYRLNSAHVHIPPLSDRLEDVPLLAKYFIGEMQKEQTPDIRGINPEAIAELALLEYPGNVRQLRQIVERAALLAGSGTIQPEHLDEKPPARSPFSRSLCSLKEDSEAHIAYVLSQTRGNKKDAAEILKVSVRQVQRRISEMKKNPSWEKVLGEL